MSALYGAAGRAHDPALTRLLLEAGANPDDGESVYHATEAESPECLRALLEHGATAEPIMLAHALDDERPEHVRLLLDAGADPKELLPHAVRRGRGPETIRLLVERGADVRHKGGEMWRKPERLRTAYQHAVLRNRDAVAAVLEELGAPTDVDFDDLAIAAVARGERPPVIPEEHDWDQQEALMLARDLTVVIERFGPDLTGVVGGSPRVPLIMHAAYLGDVERVRLLLAAGAKPDAWHALVEGSQSIEIAELLLAAGAVIDPEAADGPTRRSTSGLQHDAHAEPERHVIGPLAPCGSAAIGEEAAEHGQVQAATRVRERPISGSARAGSTGRTRRPAEREREVHRRARGEQERRVRERGSRTRPSARAPSSGSPPSSSVYSVDGKPERPRRPGRRPGSGRRRRMRRAGYEMISEAIATSSRSAAAR